MAGKDRGRGEPPDEPRGGGERERSQPGLFDAMKTESPRPPPRVDARGAAEAAARRSAEPHARAAPGDAATPPRSSTIEDEGARTADATADTAAAGDPATQEGPIHGAGTRSMPLSIAELNRTIQREIESAVPGVWVVGEISNLNRYSSGHLYFTLKDASSEIAAVMFSGANRRLRFRPEDGVEVLARGGPTVWVPRGRYQFIVEEMEPRGRGSLLEAFDALKQRLLVEGLFDPSRKRPIPLLPRRVGIVTSPDGAALRDILKVLRRRHAGVDVLIAPARVQGAEAAGEIVAAIEAIGRHGGVDVLIVGRGGGSIEDLWAFNEERVARAIVASRVPVISAVGHETDVTIADFAADVRAATPSQAAEMVVACRADLLERLGSSRARLASSARALLESARRRCERLSEHPALAGLPFRLSAQGQLLDDLGERLAASAESRLAASRQLAAELSLRLVPRHLLEVVRRRRDRARELARRLAASRAMMVDDRRARLDAGVSLLHSLSPLGVLERGYAICIDPVRRRVVRASVEMRAGDAVEVRLARGMLDCTVRTSRPPREEPS